MQGRRAQNRGSMPEDPESAHEGPWRLMARSLARPYRLEPGMVALLVLVPLYIFIADSVSLQEPRAPALALDRALPLQPAWALVYGALYLFLILLPLFIVRERSLLRRTALAYLMVWLASYACFFAYPTLAPRPAQVPGADFGAWGLRLLYNLDPPLNCFPSLHVAHSFVSAWACARVHRGVGALALACAGLVALSTLFTKQHYVLDVLAGAGLAFLARLLFLRRKAPDPIPELDHRAAPAFALELLGLLALATAGFWVAYRLSPRPWAR